VIGTATWQTRPDGVCATMRYRSAILLLLAILLALGLVHLLRPGRLNAWNIRNLPLSQGSILCFGDSLVEGVGASTEADTYPAQLGRLLGREVSAYGVSGMTAQDGLQALRENPGMRAALVIVTLGGNDILKGTPVDQTRSALQQVFAELQARGGAVAYTEVLGPLTGSRAKMHRELCRKAGVILVPDIMDGILGNDDLLAETVHPNDAGYALIAQRVAAVLRPYLTGTARR
jgi:acyl-CoA thioesterase I